MTTLEDQSRRARGERGASLVIALAFLAVFGLAATAMLSFGDASVRATDGYRTQRGRDYAADAALDTAVNRVKNDPSIGRDPAVFPGDTCNPSRPGGATSVVKLPANGPDPAMVVSCEVASGEGSGVPKDLGTNPPFALLTLGDRLTDGTTQSLGVRNTEPGPYNGTGTALFNACTGNRQETGIRFNTALYPFDVLAPLFYDCFTAPDTGSQWRVRGDVFSNSKIAVDPTGSGPVIVSPPTGAAGTIKARGGCTGSGFTCPDAGWDFADGQGQDPGIADPAGYAPDSIAGLPVVTMNTAWVNARIAECAATGHIVSFAPGIYTDGTAMNTVFGDPACKNATFWFKPDDKGTTDPSDDTTGVFYFDFRNGTPPGYACGNDINFFPVPTGDLSHAWCVGGRASDYSGQHVVGGTPYGWSPTADPTTHLLTLAPASAAGNGSGLFSFLQQTQFSNPSNAKAIDGSTADMAMTNLRPGSSIWLSGYPQVPRGAYSDVDLEIAQAGTDVTRMNAPTVQVNYGGLFSGGTCGPYTLPKPPTDGSIASVKLSTALSATDYTSFKSCMNTGDRINTAVVQYNVSRPWFQGSPYPTAKLDGARFLITATDSPDFPRQPDPAAGDPGGDCDPTKPGAQFIFGGDSRVYVANGGFEVCAGPNSSSPGSGKQIAVYGVPATPRLVPVSVASTNANLGVDNPNNALRIAEGSGLAAANIKYSHSGGCFFCSDVYEGTMTLHFAGYTPPAGYSVSNVQLRASYDTNGTSTTPIAELIGAGGSGCDNTLEPPAGSSMQAQVVDVTSCMTNSNYLGSAFDVRWHARSTCVIFSCPNGNDQLDGIEFLITLTPNNPNTTLRPANGCAIGMPNFWYGTSSPDCAVLKADSPFWSALSSRRGRMSIKGTVYAPSSAVEIDDGDVWYPLFSRGIIVRHFRLTGFSPHPGYTEPILDNFVDTTPASRQVVFLACAKESGTCAADDPTLQGRAAATFDAITNAPSVKTWSVAQH